MDLVERMRAFTFRRQRLESPAPNVKAALRSVVAVYATHPTAPLALWARTRSFTPMAYGRLDLRRQVVRVPAMRKTVFLLPREFAARAFTAARPAPAHAHRGLRRAGIDPAEYERHAKVILREAQEPATSRELARVTGLQGETLTSVLRALRYEGRLLSLAGKSLTMSAHRFVDAAAWIEEGLDAGDASDALAWLAGEYLRAYGPARAEDFAWWSGASHKAANTALASHATIDVGGGLLLPSRDRGAFESTLPLRGDVSLLPKWDAYTMAHAPDGRARFVHPDVQRLVYTPIGPGLAGDGNPVVLVGGIAVATWTMTVKDGASLQPFDTLGPRTRRRIEEKLDQVARLLAS